MKKYLATFLSLILLLNLQGCVLFVAAGAGAASTATVVNDKRSLQTMTDDQNIELTANKRINQDTLLSKTSHIVVVSFNHAVLLVGQVPDQKAKSQVQDMIQALPKVTRVYNQLEIAGPSSPDVRSNDTWITTKVKTKMLATKNLHSGQIKVVTENSTVYLMGIVSKKQASLAADTARRIDGVKRVVTLFEYNAG